MTTLGLFGLGYVGRAVALLALNQGFDVKAVDIDESVVRHIQTNQEYKKVPGTLTVSTDGSQVISEVECVIISVPTPLSSSYNVDLSPLKSVFDEIVRNFDPSSTPLPIVVESTIPPGTISEVAVPFFGEHGLYVGEDIYLAHIPERIDPGNEEWTLDKIPRVVGGITTDGTRVVCDIYDDLLDADLHPVTSPQVAAASKIVENAYRDINIAFVNEIALTMDRLNIDVEEVLSAADTKPFGFTRFSPGAGVGGHCIPVDPYLLIEKATANGFTNEFLKSARKINDQMPEYVGEKVIRELVQSGNLPQESSVLLLGKAFKPRVDDTRNSPYFPIRSKLEEYDMQIETYDPNLPEESTVDSPYTEVDVIVLITSHPEFVDLDFNTVSEQSVSIFVDGRNVYDSAVVESAGLEYVGI